MFPSARRSAGTTLPALVRLPVVSSSPKETLPAALRAFSARAAARLLAGSDSRTSTYSAGSSTICAKITARAAAKGRRAHQRWSVDGWP